MIFMYNDPSSYIADDEAALLGNSTEADSLHVYLHDSVKLQGPARKFALSWIAPFEVLSVRNVCVKLRNLRNGKIMLTHIDRIKPMYNKLGHCVFSPIVGNRKKAF